MPGSPCSSRVILIARHPIFRDFLAAHCARHHARIVCSGSVQLATRKVFQLEESTLAEERMRGGTAPAERKSPISTHEAEFREVNDARSRELAKSRTRPTLLGAVTGTMIPRDESPSSD